MILTLPHELSTRIFLFLPVRSILDYSQCSNQTSVILSDNYFWEQKGLLDFKFPIKYIIGGINTSLDRYRCAALGTEEMCKQVCITIIIRIFYYLKERNIGYPRLYFSGQASPLGYKETTFETLSANLEVGVLANNPLVGKALLRFVRAYIDVDEAGNLLTKDVRHSMKQYGVLSIPTAVEYMATMDQGRTAHSFDLTPVLRYQRSNPSLNGEEYDERIERELADVDIWTITRIEDILSSLLR